MNQFSSAWLAAHNAKAHRRFDIRNRDDESARERDLHDLILAECRKNNWIVFHGSMAHQTFRTPGEPDFVILLPRGKTLMVECKTKTGKLSPDQAAIIAWAHRLDHQIHVVRSFPDFLDAVSKSLLM